MSSSGDAENPVPLEILRVHSSDDILQRLLRQELVGHVVHNRFVDLDSKTPVGGHKLAPGSIPQSGTNADKNTIRIKQPNLSTKKKQTPQNFQQTKQKQRKIRK